MKYIYIIIILLIGFSASAESYLDYEDAVELVEAMNDPTGTTTNPARTATNAFCFGRNADIVGVPSGTYTNQYHVKVNESMATLNASTFIITINQGGKYVIVKRDDGETDTAGKRILTSIKVTIGGDTTTYTEIIELFKANYVARGCFALVLDLPAGSTIYCTLTHERSGTATLFGNGTGTKTQISGLRLGDI